MRSPTTRPPSRSALATSSPSSPPSAGAPVGFAIAEGRRHDRHALRPSGGCRGRGSATLLCDALEKLAARPRREALQRRTPATPPIDFFEPAAAIVAQQPQHGAPSATNGSATPPWTSARRRTPATRDDAANALYLFDTTLRDGAQTHGRRFLARGQAADRRHARRARHRLCRGRLSRRQPDSTREFFAEKRTLATPSFTAFGMTKRPGRSVANDPGFAGAARRQGRRHLLRRQGLGLSRSASRSASASRRTSTASARASRRRWRAAARCCSTASISSTATRPIRDYALACAKAAYEAGARWVVLCDTNGGTLPRRGRRDRRRGRQARSPATDLGIHAHNDYG